MMPVLIMDMEAGDSVGASAEATMILAGLVAVMVGEPGDQLQAASGGDSDDPRGHVHSNDCSSQHLYATADNGHTAVCPAPIAATYTPRARVHAKSN